MSEIEIKQMQEKINAGILLARKRLIEKVKREDEERMFLNCQTITDYEKYLRQYPKGKFAYKAKRAIQQIESGMMESHPTQEIHVKKSTRVSFGL